MEQWNGRRCMELADFSRGNRGRVSRHREESGFSMTELMVVLLIIAMMIGLGTLLLFGAHATQLTKNVEGTIANDLRLCQKRAEANKEIMGIHFRRYDCATNPNTYNFLDSAGDPIAPPAGASAKTNIITIPNQTRIALLGQTGASAMSYDNGKQIKIYFKPAGALIFSQYGDAGAGMYDFGKDTAGASANTGNMTVTVGNSAGTKSRVLTIMKLGDIKTL